MVTSSSSINEGLDNPDSTGYPYPSQVNPASFVSIKLSGTSNYEPWQEQMLCLLDSHDMCGFIDGTLKKPPGSKRKAEKEWKRSDTLVKGWIFGSISEDVMGTVIGLQTATDVWNELNTNYTTPPAPISTYTGEEEYVPLCRAIAMGVWEKAEECFKEDKDALTNKLNCMGQRTLHLAIGNPENIKFLANLLDLINPESHPTLVDNKGNTALHLAATLDHTKAAKKLVEKNPHLLFIFGYKGLPIHEAVYHSQKETFLYLLQASKQHIGLSQKEGCQIPFKDVNGYKLLSETISAGFFNEAYVLLKEHPELATTIVANHKSLLCSIGEARDAFRSAKSYNFYQRFVYSNVPTKNHGLEDTYKVLDIENQETNRASVVTKCTKIYPVIKRIYDKFWEFAILHGNNLLHLVGQLAPIHKLNMVTGAALQMQRELQWFQDVSKLIRPKNRAAKNKKQETPIMVFRKEHEGLRQKGEYWMKKTADSYTITAALIITIAFAAAITVPGGNNDDTGKAIYKTRISFIIFIVSDAISMFTSTTSLLLFLSILTARYAEEDFLYKLPKRLILGLVMLFMSVTTMLIAFSATLFITFGEENSWILIPIAAITCLPIASFVTLQLPLLVDLISSTYGPGIFDKRSKRRIT